MAGLTLAATPGTGGRPIPREVGKGVTFSTNQPGAVTGTDFQVVWQNPDNIKTGKPQPVTKVVLHYAPGTKIDTSVPDRCTASDPEIMAQGAAACPPGSKIGGGVLHTDQGSPGPTYVKNTVTVFSNGNDLIFLLETTNPPTKLVAHTQISGSTTTTNVPYTPGFPPTEGNALKDETLHFPPYARGGKSYTTTPPTCPAAGYWANTLVITYKDGVTEKLVGRSPCQVTKPPPHKKKKLTVAMTGIPTECTSSSFVVHVRIRNAASPRTSKLKVDGQTIRTTSRLVFKQRVHAESLKHGSHSLEVRVNTPSEGLAKGLGFSRC